MPIITVKALPLEDPARVPAILQGVSRRFAEAAEVLDRGAELMPDSGHIWDRRARARVELGDLEGALADCEEGLELFSPGHPVHNALMGLRERLQRELGR